MRSFTAIIFFIILSLTSNAQGKSKLVCDSLHKGTFQYMDMEDASMSFDIDGSRHTEYYMGGKYTVKSSVQWLGDCQYTRTILFSNVPNAPFHPGDVITVTIKKIKGDVIFFVNELQKLKWEGKMSKIK